MSETWPDLPGITIVGGHPRLPRRPAVATAVFEAVCGMPEGTSLSELVAAVQHHVRDEVPRIEGLAGWLPLSGVVRWTPNGLARHPGTSPYDLALRFGAWVGGQRVARDSVEAVTAYARTLVEGVSDRTPGEDGPWVRAEEDGEEVAAASVRGVVVSERIGRMLASLDAAFVERRQHVRVVLLALLAGQHALLLGPPGTAKSLLARAVSRCFSDATYFEYLLSRFTHPDELFGPISIPGLKEEDYRRLTEGFLPRAEVAFLDEIFKANSAILNSLLTLINERVFHHGRHRDPVPLLGVVGASNELPDPEGGLGALYDRFLVRMTVPPISGSAEFIQVATGALPVLEIDLADAISPAEVLELRARAAQVAIPPSVESALLSLWRKSTESEWQVSDRRWRWAVNFLKTAAASEERDRVGLLDLLLLEHVLAPDPRSAPEVRDVLIEVVAPRAIPEHDLSAQWTLLRFDRVAPSRDEALMCTSDGTWRGRLALRRLHVDRVIRSAEDAVKRLASDRRRLEGTGASRLWVTEPPPRVLAAHLRAGRELARVLELAERYRRELTDVVSVAEALMERLPRPVRREFTAGVALRLRLAETGKVIGLSLAGERVSRPEGSYDEPEAGRAGQLARRGAPRVSFDLEAFERAAELVVTAEELVAFLRGDLDVTDLSSRLEIRAGRQALAVLQRVRKHLGESGVPAPGPYPAATEIAS